MDFDNNLRNDEIAMELEWKGKGLTFTKVNLEFSKLNMEDLFAKKNNKTLRQTLESHRYRSLEDEVLNSYSAYLDIRLGIFLMDLKDKGDIFYLKFLNKHMLSVLIAFVFLLPWTRSTAWLCDHRSLSPKCSRQVKKLLN